MKVNFMHKFFILVCSMLVFSYGNDCGCDLPDLTLSLAVDGTVYYNSSADIGGWQFDVIGASACGYKSAYIDRYDLPLEDRGYSVDIHVQNFSQFKDQILNNKIPDIFGTGHVQGHFVGDHKGTTLVHSSTWQDQTDFQRMLGFQPKPCILTVVNLHTFATASIPFN